MTRTRILLVTIDSETDIDIDLTDANAVIAAINSLTDWSASRDTSNELTNDGTGQMTVSTSGDAATTDGGSESFATLTVTPQGSDNDFSITATNAGPTFNSIQVHFEQGLSDGTATAEFNSATDILLITIDAETAIDANLTVAQHGDRRHQRLA